MNLAATWNTHGAQKDKDRLRLSSESREPLIARPMFSVGVHYPKPVGGSDGDRGGSSRSSAGGILLICLGIETPDKAPRKFL